MLFATSVAGRFALEALAFGQGEVCAVFRRSFYLRIEDERGVSHFTCVGDTSLGHGPLNALVPGLELPAIGAKISVATRGARLWEPPAHAGKPPDLEALKAAASGRVPEEGLGCLILGSHNALSGYAHPALEALERWLVGNALAGEAELLIGLGPGLTPLGDDYLGGMLLALRTSGRGVQADALWRWLQPRLTARTSAISAAHLAAAASGQAHEALHEVLNGELGLDKLDAVGHCSGWDGLAGALAVFETY